LKNVPTEESYTCGLLHLIGKTLLDRFGDADYEEVDRLIEGGFPELQAETEVFGIHHAAMTLAAAEKWGFPPALMDGLNYVTPPQPNEGHQEVRACLAVSSPIASFAIDGKNGGANAVLSLPTWATRILAIPEESHLELISGAIQVLGNSATLH
jgi:HD-like signal output (HDOD) protein